MRFSHLSKALISAALVLSACEKPAPKVSVQPRPVKVMTLAESEGERLVAIGVARAQQRASLSFQTSGRLVEIDLQPGDRVSAGQVLARIDPEPFRLRVAQAEAEVARVRAVVTEAEGRLMRQKRLEAGGWVAPAALDAIRAEVDSARAGLNAAQIAVDISRRDLHLTVIRAPFAGTVGARQAEPFTEVAPGAPILELDGSNDIEVVAPVPTGWAARLKPGMAVTLSTASGQTQGLIHQLSARADAGGAIEAIIRGPAELLKPGEAVRVALPTGGTQALSLPFAAIVLSRQEGSGHVFVMHNNRVEPRAVTFERLDEDNAAIISGLAAGEVVVTAGARFLTKGQAVTVITERRL